MNSIIRLSGQESAVLESRVEEAFSVWIDTWACSDDTAIFRFDSYAGFDSNKYETITLNEPDNSKSSAFIILASDWKSLLFSSQWSEIPEDDVFRGIVSHAENQLLIALGSLVGSSLQRRGNEDIEALSKMAILGKNWFECAISIGSWSMCLVLSGCFVKKIVGRKSTAQKATLISKENAFMSAKCKLDVSLDLGGFELSSFHGLSVGDVLTTSTSLDEPLRISLGNNTIAKGQICQKDERKAVKVL